MFSSLCSIVNDRGVRDSRAVYYAGVDSVGKCEGGLLLVSSRVLRSTVGAEKVRKPSGQCIEEWLSTVESTRTARLRRTIMYRHIVTG